jgi:hypothetical protein
MPARPICRRLPITPAEIEAAMAAARTERSRVATAMVARLAAALRRAVRLAAGRRRRLVSPTPSAGR